MATKQGLYSRVHLRDNLTISVFHFHFPFPFSISTVSNCRRLFILVSYTNIINSNTTQPHEAHTFKAACVMYTVQQLHVQSLKFQES